MKPGLLTLESLRYLFGSGAADEGLDLGRVWGGLESTRLALTSLRENLEQFGSALLLAPAGFAAESVYRLALAQLRQEANTLCLPISEMPLSGEGLWRALNLASGNAHPPQGDGDDWRVWRDALSSGEFPWRRVVFVLENAQQQLANLWLQPGSRSAGGLRRLLGQFRASKGHLALLGYLESCGSAEMRAAAGNESLITATGDELAALCESFPGLVSWLGHLDLEGLTEALRGPLLQVRRESLVRDLENSPTMRRCLASCQRLLPDWGGSSSCYPFHPLAWAALPRMTAAYPHPQRNFSSFFQENQGSTTHTLHYWLGNTKILGPQGLPNLFTLDLLFSYFEPVWRGREGLDVLMLACEQARNIPLARRLLRAIWLANVLHSNIFPTTSTFLIEALDLRASECDTARVSLEKMEAAQILLREGVGAEGTYILPLPGRREARGRARIEPLVWQTFLKRFSDTTDLQAELRARLPLRRLKLYTFNRTHASDRWARIQLTTFQGLQEAAGLYRESWLAQELAALGAPVAGDRRCPADARRSSRRARSESGCGYAGDILLLYVALLDHEEMRLFQELLMQGSWRHPRLILAYPKSESAPLRSARQELRLLSAYRWGTRLIVPYCDPLSGEAHEMNSRVEQLQGSIARKFREFFNPENLEFYGGDGVVETNVDIAGLHRLLHERFMRVVGDPPAVLDPVFASASDRPAYRRVRRAALGLLLQGDPQIPLWSEGGSHARALIHGLVDTGLVQVLEQGQKQPAGSLKSAPRGILEALQADKQRRERPGYYLIAPPSSQIWSVEASGLADIFALLEDQLLRSSQQKESLERALAFVCQAPYSLTRATCELLLGVFFWAHGSACQLFEVQTDFGVPGESDAILAREGWEGALPLGQVTADSIASIVACPGRFYLSYSGQSNDAQNFLEGITSELDRDFQRVEGVDLWKAATRRVLDWYRQLDDKTTAISRERTPFNRPLLELLARFAERSPLLEEGLRLTGGAYGGQSASLDEKAMFERLLPAALGLSAEGRRNWPMETQTLLDRFRLVRISIERAVSATPELLHLGLTEIFFEPTLNMLGRQLDWPVLVQQWHRNLPESTRQVRLDGPLYRLIEELAEGEGGDRDTLLENTLAQLAYPPIGQWTQDYVPEILERFRLAREEMENADLSGLFPAPPQVRWQRLEEFLRRALMRVDIEREELRTVVAAELESFWER